ncbi:RpiB/LacA/LacB family sugar-phosphate isomerase [Candidatus Woesearchaeota archaeon]|nr:RpiB/LacA/LacB family sugar-phosphate isomerase [Candidatus Woesearchaeota archaeon]MCF8013847.1 RpiB/LacA/LacB family sugar-phosphate isomerase [Candidatus Woesearchaeota archaeon]
MKQIIIATDHAGAKLKPAIEKALINLKITYEDHSIENKKTDDYPDFAKDVALEVSKSKNKLGILSCGTGIGMSITANKIKGIRAALCHTKKEAELSRKHNDANILILPGQYSSTKLTEPKIKEIIKTFYETKPSQETKHKRRIQKIKKLEK